MQIELYDLETIVNCFTATFLNAATKEVHQFVVHPDRDERNLLYEFISQDINLIGFNCIDFDTPILQFFYDNWQDPKLNKKLYKYAQKLIESERKYKWEVRWKQRDLFKIWHFENKGRMASLKWLQINMKFENVEDMSITHSKPITALQIPEVLRYNLNDVKATERLYELTKGKIRMRQKLGAKYGVDMGNFNDPKIGEYIILKMLSDRIGISVEGLRKCRTPRREVHLKDVILPEIKFNSKFNEIYDAFQGTTVDDNTQKIEHTVNYDGVDYYFGLGGLHACRGAGVYRNIHSCDVTGYYPTLAVSKKFTPAHFGEAFTEVYKQIALERAGYPKGSDENLALKLAQNGTFGKTNSEFSAFYDPKMFYQITINGQLLLAMLCEQITESGAGRIVLANTDGIEVEVKDESLYKRICREWEGIIGLKLEHTFYPKLIVRDINNYTCGVKEKGVFVCKPELHQNHSQLIVPKALKEYLFKGVPIEDTVRRETDISLFLIGKRAKKGKFYSRKLDVDKVVDVPLPKHIRYYIATKGFFLRKRTEKTDGGVHVKYKVSLFNEWRGGVNDINYDYYINECYKILDIPQNEIF